ncbi:hypothetical protein [Leptospira borgpetersenii]|uniref:Uncharacterized protein n=2 Tax=Leptospira borgpetersenii TaxID=174 RepID=A0A0S2IRY6_LEPBO|nr:hypothetical protein [Leptospira borgpetersenii]ALO26426.1 hypothetical protein LBBP_02166 [Leptospira borgpetersenii serovar Ballum]MBE8224192.1 hypothetical protein [Leptospira borgpetersenii serovar Ballum]MBE8245500.1 hypothetical protein [Leptospira borgpetersenii serovar Ballum]MBE8409458.1 hypothetical protein [Leptospira borgpetersenii serovar Ballum]
MDLKKSVGTPTILRATGSATPAERPVGSHNLTHKYLDLKKSVGTPTILRATGSATPAERPVGSHNLTHKYLDLKINLSELLQILCETYAPP